MKPNILILGATGSIGYAVTVDLIARQFPVTILVRNRAKAEKLFPAASTLTIVEGDAQDADLLKRLATNKDVIFHGLNYPYHQWFGNMDVVTQKIIAAASPNTTIVFPGNIYSLGLAKEPIREDTPPNPCTRKGQLRLAIESMLEEAAQAGRCRVINVRLPDFWGPNVMNDGIRPIFENALTGNAIPWLISADIPHQTVFTPDAADIIGRLITRHWQTPDSQISAYSVWNYGGHTFPSMRWLFAKLAAQTGNPLKIRVYSRTFISMMGWFLPVLREVKEMSYLYENTVVLDDSRVRHLFPDFQEKPLDQALTETLQWFAHQKGQSFTPQTNAQAATVR